MLYYFSLLISFCLLGDVLQELGKQYLLKEMEVIALSSCSIELNELLLQSLIKLYDIV